MTHTGPLADHEGDFSGWSDQPGRRCHQMVPVGTTEPVMSGHHLRDEGTVYLSCGAAVQWRTWESHDGAYEDYQYRCANGHTWWVDGIDS